jgi:hypothetical protein
VSLNGFRTSKSRSPVTIKCAFEAMAKANVMPFVKYITKILVTERGFFRKKKPLSMLGVTAYKYANSVPP